MISFLFLASMQLSWVPPTQNTDGTQLTNLASYRILWRCGAGTGYPFQQIIPADGSGYLIENLSEGQECFSVVTAINSESVESAFSNEASKSFPVSPVADPTQPPIVTFVPSPKTPEFISAVAFGSSSNFGTQVLQIPEEADSLVLFWEGYLTNTMGTLTVGGRQLIAAQNVAATGSPDFLRAAGAAFIEDPSGDLVWDWNGFSGAVEGVVFIAAYLGNASGIAESKIVRRPGDGLFDTLTFSPGLLLGMVCSARPPSQSVISGEVVVNDFIYNVRSCDLGVLSGSELSGNYGYGTLLGVRVN